MHCFLQGRQTCLKTKFAVQWTTSKEVSNARNVHKIIFSVNIATQWTTHTPCQFWYYFRTKKSLIWHDGCLCKGKADVHKFANQTSAQGVNKEWIKCKSSLHRRVTVWCTSLSKLSDLRFVWTVLFWIFLWGRFVSFCAYIWDWQTTRLPPFKFKTPYLFP